MRLRDGGRLPPSPCALGRVEWPLWVIAALFCRWCGALGVLLLAVALLLALWLVPWSRWCGGLCRVVRVASFGWSASGCLRAAVVWACGWGPLLFSFWAVVGLGWGFVVLVWAFLVCLGCLVSAGGLLGGVGFASFLSVLDPCLSGAPLHRFWYISRVFFRVSYGACAYIPSPRPFYSSQRVSSPADALYRCGLRAVIF